MKTDIARAIHWLFFAALISTAWLHSSYAQEDAMQYVGLKGKEVLDIALVPSGDVLAATNQGVWRAGNDGKQLSELTANGLPRPMDKCFVNQVVANSKGNIFISVGTGGGDGQGKEGVFRLDPKGNLWSSLGKEVLVHANTREAVEALAVLPDDTLFCSISTISIYAGQTRVAKLFRSLDGGDSWEETPNAVSPSLHSGSVVAGQKRQLWMFSGGWEVYASLPNVTCWIVTTDDWRGKPISWRTSTLQPGNRTDAKGFGDHDIVITRVACDRKGAVYALVTDGKPPYVAGVYRSLDKGGSWQRTTPEKQSSLQRHGLVVTPEGHIYASSYGNIIRSLDGGTTWGSFASLETIVTDLLVDRGGYLWAATSTLGLPGKSTGLFRSKQPIGKGDNPWSSTDDSSTATNTTDGTKATNPTNPIKEPASVTRMTLQAGKRTVQKGQSVTVPVWLLKAQGVANMNFNVRYDASVAASTGAFSKGNLLDNSLFQANPKESGLVRVGFAQKADLSGDGTVVNLTFQANGAPGSRTPLTLEVTTVSGAGGGKPAVDLIHGEIVIVGKDGAAPGDSDGDNQITARDAGEALKMSVKLIPENKVCDMDHDGQVTSTDARLILAKASGK